LKHGVPDTSPQHEKQVAERALKDLDMDEFYACFGEFYSPSCKKHESPTKRLIKQKNSTVEHKNALKDSHTQKYGIHYTTDPGRSYLMEPKGGQLNYKSAR
jgi:hypothetical protein